jgi:hypothetical protein
MYIETKKRSVTKAVTWRVCAVVNSYVTLVYFSNSGNLEKALLMNVSGFFVFYLFERVWNKIQWGKKSVISGVSSTVTTAGN